MRDWWVRVRVRVSFRQKLLFSATFRPNLERLARDVLTEPVR